MKKTICIVLTLIMLLSVFAGCGKDTTGRDTETTGSGVKQNDFENITASVIADAQTLIGSASKDGIEITIPGGTFDGATNVSVKTADITAGSGATPLSPVYEITEENLTHWLSKEVTVSIKLPDGYDISDCYKLVGGYYNGSEWVYIEPDFAALENGFVTFDTPHFSPFAAFSLEDSEAISMFAYKTAVMMLDATRISAEVTKALTEDLIETLDKMGINDKTAQGIIIQSIAKESNIGALVTAEQNGNMDDFAGTSCEMIADSVLRCIGRGELTDYLPDGLLGIAVSGAVAGAENVYEGQYGEAYKAFLYSAMEYFPYMKAAKAVIATAEAGNSMCIDYAVEWVMRNI